MQKKSKKKTGCTSALEATILRNILLRSLFFSQSEHLKVCRTLMWAKKNQSIILWEPQSMLKYSKREQIPTEATPAMVAGGLRAERYISCLVHPIFSVTVKIH